ncbi:MAG: choice-of-anchor D domain-containing protein [Chloroflexales bacterium]
MPNPSRSLRMLLPLLVAALLVVTAPTPTLTRAATTPATARPTDQLIVTLKPDTTASLQVASQPNLVAAALSAEVGTEMTYVRSFDAESHILRLASRRPYAEVEALAQQLTASPDVLFAEPDAMLQPTLEPTDPYYSRTWHLWGVTPTNYGANLPAAWNITTGSASIVTAIIDTGGRLTHEDLAGRTLASNPGYDMIADVDVANDGNGRDADPSDPGDYVTPAEATPGCGSSDSSWHGSHVGGTIGARANNGKGIAGINWTSPLLFVRALGKCGGYNSDVIDSVRWAAGLPVTGVPTNPNPARVLNLSLGGYGSCSAAFQTAVNAVTAAGAVMVVAAGNENEDAANAQPASCANVITVAATAKDGNRAWYSNYGALVELAGPGGDTTVDSGVYSTVDRGTYGPAGDAYASYQGTSMATPHVAGIVSLMLSANPALTPAQVLQILQKTVTPFPVGSDCRGICGAGIVNAGAAVESAASMVRSINLIPASLSFSNQPVGSVGLTQTLTISNPSVLALTVSGTTLTGDFTRNGGTCSLSYPFTVVPGGSCTLDLAFAPQRLGRRAGTLSVTSNATVSTKSVSLSGTSTVPALGFGPASLSFADQLVGTTSPSQSLTLTNPGTAPLVLNTVTPSSEYQVVSTTCAQPYPATLAPGASCTVSLSFTPQASGARPGTLTVGSNVPGSPYSARLSGKGLAPAVALDAANVNFSGQVVGTSATRTVTVTNTGNATLTISGTNVSGTSFARAVGGSCATSFPATLAAGASCTLVLTFTPAAAATYTGNLTLTSNALGSGTTTLPLIGVGTAGPTASLLLNPASLAFGNQPLAAVGATQTVTISNQGGAAMNVSGITIAGAGFALANSTCGTLPITLTASTSCTVGVSLTTTLIGTYSGTLTVTSDVPGGAQLVPLTGVGVAATNAYTITALTFGGDGTTTSINFTISRSGQTGAAANIGYSLGAKRTTANTDLPLAFGNAVFAAGTTTITGNVSLARLGLYGGTDVALSLDSLTDGGSPAALRTVAIPPYWYSTYLPLSWR